eukprot:3040766-Prorocentrum_lima.AAC.1
MEHHQAVRSLEERAQSHHDSVVRENEEESEAQLQQKQASANHEHSVLTSNAKRHERQLLVVHKKKLE